MSLRVVKIEEHFCLYVIAVLWLHPVRTDDKKHKGEDWPIGLLPCSTAQTNTSNYVCHYRSQSSLNPTKINQMNDSFNRFSVHWNWAAIAINANPSQGHLLNCKLGIYSCDPQWLGLGKVTADLISRPYQGFGGAFPLTLYSFRFTLSIIPAAVSRGHLSFESRL